MAHLMEPEAPDLVQHIAAERNFARVADLASIGALIAWLERNGLTAAEAALIQPGYPSTPAEACVCSAPNATLLEGVVSANLTKILVTATHGAPSEIGPGDMVTLAPTPFLLAKDDVVLARYIGTGYVVGPLEGDVLAIGGTSCEWGMSFATAPTDLPLEVFLAASNAPDFDTCVSILADYSSDWATEPTTAAATGVGGSSTTATTTVASGAGGFGGAGTEPGGGGGMPSENDVTVTGPGCACSVGRHDAVDLGGWGLMAGLTALAVARRRSRRDRAIASR